MRYDEPLTAPRFHRPGAEFPGMSDRAQGACMECSWFEDGIYVPWPCGFVDSGQPNLTGNLTTTGGPT